MIDLALYVYAGDWAGIAFPVLIPIWLFAAVITSLGIAGAIRHRDRQTPQDRQAVETEPGGLIATPDLDDDDQ